MKTPFYWRPSTTGMNWTRFWEVRGPEIVAAERMRQNMARVAHPRNYGATTWSEGTEPRSTFGPIDR